MRPNGEVLAVAAAQDFRTHTTTDLQIIGDLAAAINAERAAATGALRDAVAHAVRAGELLIEAKDTMPHGSFGAFCAGLPFAETTARGYMRLARLDPANRQRVADMPLRTALLEIAEPQPEPDEAARNHRTLGTGENEWYTPAEYVEAAREVMGSIDLDPASCVEANEVVKAEAFYTKDEDGLAREWSGNVWLNPPYSRDLMPAFVEKLKDAYQSGAVTSAVVLSHNNTDTTWFHSLALSAVFLSTPRSARVGTDGIGSTSDPIDFRPALAFGMSLMNDPSIASARDSVSCARSMTSSLKCWRLAYISAAAATSAIRFAKQRIKFYRGDDVAAPTNGQAFFYLGKSEGQFAEVFDRLGLVLVPAP